MRVNGLYGHVRKNDMRSVALFAGFIAAFHVLGAMALLVPLAMLDPEHAPLYGWTGYFTRWVPILTVVGAIVFAVQMAWHVRTVRRRTEFRFVDGQDEPRLCGIVEPLAIAAGLPAPYVGVIESPALNAFACGIRQKDAVLVFTRGLIDGLDDDELASVAAHEIVHIVNGDIRLIAATNVCLETLWFLQPRRHPKLVNRVWEAAMMPVLALLLPLLAVLILVVSFVRRLAVDGSHLTRLLIASAREFVADAEAVRLTQNPAALVSALRRIDGKSEIPGLAAGQDAMMIDGAHEGAFATHPTIGERIAALVAVTGSMALIAPARRDTRAPEVRAAGGFGRRPAALPELAVPRPRRRGGLMPSASAAHGFNRLGLTREMTVGAAAAVGLFVWTHGTDMASPQAMAKVFDPAPMRTFFAMGGKGLACQLQGIGGLAGLTAMPTDCDVGEMLTAHRGEGGLMGLLADQEGYQTSANGTFSNIRSPEAKLAEVRQAKCFQSDSYSVGDRGLHSVDKPERDGDSFYLPRWLASGDTPARLAAAAPAAERDAALLEYFKWRKIRGETIHRFFGEPGLAVANARFAEPLHQNAAAALRERLADPQFRPDLSPLERSEIELLAAQPLDFVSCKARRDRTAQASTTPAVKAGS